jgi:hypothetical protein
MAAKYEPEKAAEEIRHLFAELAEVYAQATVPAESPPPSGSITDGRIGEERRKASAIIQRIRELQSL